MVKRIVALGAVVAAVAVVGGCDRYDLKGLFVPTSDLIATRFEQSMAVVDGQALSVVDASEEYMFYVCTDPHVDATNNNMRTFTDALRNDADASFGVVLGDLTDRPGKFPFYLEATVHDSSRHQYNLPIFNVLGNHDIFFDGWGDYLKLIGPSVYWVEVHFAEGRDIILVLDSATGTLGVEQTKWLKEFLATNRTKYRHCIICKHTNLFNTDNTQSTSGNMPFEESFALLDLFARHDVTLVLQGHDHYREDLTYDGVRYTIVGTIKDGADEPEYLKVTLNSEGFRFDWVSMK